MNTAAQRPDDAPQWHALSIEDAVAEVGSDTERGLASGEAAERLERFGPNALPDAESRSLIAVFIGQLKSPLIYLLIAAAAIALLIGERTDAVVILFVVLLNAVIGAVQEGRAERALEALRQLAHHRARVVRDGREAVIEAREVARGDLLLMASGETIAADARLIDTAALEVAEAALTGESVPVRKDVKPVAPDTPTADRTDMVYAGTHVTAGRGRAVVVGTGSTTEVGGIAALTESAEQPNTPLEQRVEQFGRYIIVGAIAVFTAIVGIGLARGVAFGEIFMIGVSSLVGMVPEGLPVAMTIALAVGVQRMARRRAVVRHLSAVETLGSATVICSDKTGTLTRNEMTVTSIYLADGRQISVEGVGYRPDGHTLPTDDDAALRELLEAGVLCNDAQLEDDEPVGDPTEVALLTVALKGGVVPAELRERQRRRAELPFDPAHKMMATAHASEDASFVVVKGAPEAVLELCDTSELGDEGLQAVRDAAAEMASQALRLLAIATARDTELDPEAGFGALEGKLKLLGLVGQYDPPRTEVADAVKVCRAAGIRPVVVTGDHKQTGLAIAKELGIARPDDAAVDGTELEKMSAEELEQRIDGISLFARVHPAQKLRIIEAYQKRGEVVAMTGDGVNDAPALVRANVGVAMGITGTEVAKDASDIIIADDNFATIVAAVEEGRVVYRNIKKAVLLLFSTSAAEVVVLMLALLFGYPPPFAAVQILWNNLVTEGVITVNLIMEPAEGDEMRQRPNPPDEPLLTRTLLTRMGVMIPVMVATTLGWFMVRSDAGVPTAQVQTETFTLLVICEWFNTLNCRSERKSALSLSLLRNLWLLGGLVIGGLLQVAVVLWRPLGDLLRTVPFGFAELLALVAIGSTVLWAEEARKLVQRIRERRQDAAT